MTHTANIQQENNFFAVSGELNFITVVKLWKQSLPLLSQSSALDFDFGQVSASNSAGVALLLEWLKYAKQQQKSVSFKNIPKHLHSIIAVSGVSEILERN
jgi:phospholipid transport system transporter-binding protein